MKKHRLQLFSVFIGIIYAVSSSPCHRRNKRCTMPECDLKGALSMCAVADPHCPPHHDDVFDVPNICETRGLRCCRSTCNGTGSMCLPRGNPCIEGYTNVTGRCPAAVNGEYHCCKPIPS